MRLLFVSGTTVGGSGRSQRELADRLAERGHQIEFLVDADDAAKVRRWAYGHLSDLSVRMAAVPGAAIIRWFESLPGRRPSSRQIGGRTHQVSPIPENAAERVIDSFRPDVVIGNSILRLTWRKVRSLCVQRGITTVLYIREVEALNHFQSGSTPADAVVANAESLARQIEGLGFDCAVFPSVIETGVTRVESSRQTALVINPIESRGIATVWELAKRMPHVPFAVQESWPLTSDELEAVQRHVAELPNVEFRRTEPPGPQLYRDARTLLVPYRIDNRPRVIPEAHANSIPTIVANSPALVEAAGPGGLVVDPDDLDGWCAAIDSLWNDPELYESLCTSALAHSTRDEISAAAVAARFDDFVRATLDRSRVSPD